MQGEVAQERVKDNAYAILFEKEDGPKLQQLIAGNKIQTADGAAFRHLNFINQPWASKIEAFNRPGKFQRALKPKSTLITETLARKTQILYAMDNSAILLKLNIVPGSVVVEAGTGSGSLSCAFSETIKDGHLFTFEFNQQRAEITKQFFLDLGLTNVTSTWRDVVNNGFAVEGVEVSADALFLDVPNPWAALVHAKRALKTLGRICCFSPCIEQVQRTAAELRRQRFANIQTVECLAREIELGEKEVEEEGISEHKRSFLSRAAHNSRGHTGYLTFAVSL